VFYQRKLGNTLTRSRVNKLLADSAILSLGSGGARVASLASSLGAAAILGVVGFGGLGYLLATVATFAGIGSLAVPAIVVREVAQRPRAVKRTLSAAFLLVGATTIGATFVGLALLWFTGQNGFWNTSEEAPWGLLVGAIMVMACAQALSAVAMSALTGGQAFRSWTFISLGKAVLVGTVTVIFATTQSVPLIISAIAVAEVIGCVAAVRLTRRLEPSRRTEKQGHQFYLLFSDARELLRESIAPGIAGQSIALANWFALTLLLNVAGSEAIGTYMIALRIVTGASFIPMSFVDASLGRLHREATRIQESTQITFLITRSFAAAVVTAVALIICAPAISLLGTDFDPAVVTIRILALSLPLIILNVVIGNIALSRRRMRLWAVSDVILAVTLLLATISMIQSFEANGLAASTVIAYLVSVLVLALPMRVWKSRQGKNSQ